LILFVWYRSFVFHNQRSLLKAGDYANKNFQLSQALHLFEQYRDWLDENEKAERIDRTVVHAGHSGVRRSGEVGSGRAAGIGHVDGPHAARGVGASVRVLGLVKAHRGVVEDRNIINKLAEINENKAAVYSFAGGSKFNEYLLDLLSYRNKGESRFERTKRDVADSLFEFYEEVRDPIRLKLRFQIGTVSETEVYPKVLPDFFLKSRITICGQSSDLASFKI